MVAAILEGVLGFGLLRGLVAVMVGSMVVGDMLTSFIQLSKLSLSFISSSPLL